MCILCLLFINFFVSSHDFFTLLNWIHMKRCRLLLIFWSIFTSNGLAGRLQWRAISPATNAYSSGPLRNANENERKAKLIIRFNRCNMFRPRYFTLVVWLRPLWMYANRNRWTIQMWRRCVNDDRYAVVLDVVRWHTNVVAIWWHGSLSMAVAISQPNRLTSLHDEYSAGACYAPNLLFPVYGVDSHCAWPNHLCVGFHHMILQRNELRNRFFLGLENLNNGGRSEWPWPRFIAHQTKWISQLPL